ncbi:hypothetical protein ACIGW3_31865 [Streptomyces sp. NPDC053499]|uniref:hypothetical protein n=1 Tax=Streptomyces sp. NPDC053499 TaxID=3365707 RepID=UPI0037D97906
MRRAAARLRLHHLSNTAQMLLPVSSPTNLPASAAEVSGNEVSGNEVSGNEVSGNELFIDETWFDGPLPRTIHRLGQDGRLRTRSTAGWRSPAPAHDELGRQVAPAITADRPQTPVERAEGRRAR